MARSDKQRMALVGSEPSPEPVLRRRQRVIVMTLIDEAVFSEALREAHPRVAFGDDAVRRGSIADCKARTVTIWVDGSAASRRHSGKCRRGSASAVAAVGRLWLWAVRVGLEHRSIDAQQRCATGFRSADAHERAPQRDVE